MFTLQRAPKQVSPSDKDNQFIIKLNFKIPLNCALFTLMTDSIGSVLVSRNMKKRINRRKLNFSVVLKIKSIINMKKKERIKCHCIFVPGI